MALRPTGWTTLLYGMYQIYFVQDFINRDIYSCMLFTPEIKKNGISFLKQLIYANHKICMMDCFGKF